MTTTRTWQYLAFSLIVGLMVGGLCLGMAAPVHAEAPQPLPDECGGVNPPGVPDPVCCVFGYVYVDGAPAAGIPVTITGASGAFSLTTTASGSASSSPYFRADLSGAPLSVTANSLITVTAQHGQDVRQVFYRVVPGSQQVDVVLPQTGFWSTPDNITNDPAPSTDVNMVMDSTGRLHMTWRDMDGGRIAYATRSRDGGAFDRGYIEGSGGWADGHNSLFVDQNDALYLVMSKGDSIYYSQKPAGGGWTTAVSIHTTSGRAELPSITVDGLQTVHVVWDDWQNGELWYISKPAGGSWGIASVITDSGGELWSPSIVADSANTLHVVYHAGVSAPWEIYYIYKPAGGEWSEPVNISQTAGDGSSYPDMIIDGDDGLHVVWYEDPAAGGGDVY